MLGKENLFAPRLFPDLDLVCFFFGSGAMIESSLPRKTNSKQLLDSFPKESFQYQDNHLNFQKPLPRPRALV